MWLSDRRGVLLALAALPVAACGFSPAYGPGGVAAAMLGGRIRADDPGDGDAFRFVARLEERLGRPSAPAYRLAYALTVRDDRQVRTPALTESRGQVLGTVRYALHPVDDTAGETTLARGEVQDFAGYSLTSTPLANRTAEEDARRRLMVMLADGVVTRLLATAPSWDSAREGAGGA